MMEHDLVGKRPNIRQSKRRSNFYLSVLLVGLIFAVLGVWTGLRRGTIRQPFLPTPTLTRNAQSYILEARAYFDAGKLDDPSNNITPVPTLVKTPQKGAPSPTPTSETPEPTPTQVPRINDAIEAYQAALQIEPENAQAWADLARIQAYSSQMLRNDTERLARLKDALRSADKAAELSPDDSSIHAIRAFVMDWYAYNSLVPVEESQNFLRQAESEATRAFKLDPNNALALAFYAEILADQQKWYQGEKYALQAVTQAPDLMDAHRVYAYVLETLGQYNSAIQQYQKAAELAPNMTFLYVRIGVNFREGIKNPDRALEYFDRAAKINVQLGVQNPLPYLEIARTYTQQGQFFAASVNAEKALSFDNTNAGTYGQLGIIYIRARNYEGAVPLLKCAVLGCKAEENEMGKADVEGLPLSNLTVAYYYVEYGTVLAFLSRANENYCPQALPILNQVKTTYPEDPFLTAIVEDSEGLCRRLQNSLDNPNAGSPTPTLTGTPARPGMPVRTATPAPQ